MFGSMDLGISIRDALDLKEILKHISEMERVQRAQKRMDVIAAVFDNDVENFKEKVANRLSGMEKGCLLYTSCSARRRICIHVWR